VLAASKPGPQPDGERDLRHHLQVDGLAQLLQALVGDPDALTGLAARRPLHRGQAGLLDGQLERVQVWPGRDEAAAAVAGASTSAAASATAATRRRQPFR
jgi:hypothetical protein